MIISIIFEYLTGEPGKESEGCMQVIIKKFLSNGIEMLTAFTIGTSGLSQPGFLYKVLFVDLNYL